MESVTLKKNYLYIVAIVIIFVTLSIVFLFNWNVLHGIPEQREKADFLITFALISFFLSVYIPYKYLKNPEILITNSEIKFDDTVYPITSIKELLLTGKRNSIFSNAPIDTIKIVFNNDEVLFIDCWKYVNINQAKKFLEEIYYQKEDKNSDDIKQHTLLKKLSPVTDFFYFKGSFLGSFQGLFFISLMIGYLYLGFIPAVNSILIILIIFIPAIYLYSAFQVFYIGINNQQLIIKNYLMPWIKTIYWFSDIKEIRLNSNIKAPFSITITNENFRNKKYLCGTIRNSEWRKLAIKFKELEIVITNELNL